MNRKRYVVVVLFMLALSPLRAFAITTIGLCAMDQEHSPAAHAHAGAHENCNACAEHCASAALVSSAAPLLPAPPADTRIGFAAPAASAFFPDPLHPPPLAA